MGRQPIMVTGAAGLLGGHLARHLVSIGHRVVAVDDLSGGVESNVPRDSMVDFQLLDLNDFDRFMSLCRDSRPQVIFHFAAYAAEGLSPFVRRYNYERNLLASASVVNAAIEMNAKVIFTSSMAVYGRQEPPFREEMAPAPIDPYGIAKAAVESDLACASEQHGLRWSIVRPHNVIGVGQNIWDRYRNVVGIYIRKALAGEPLPVFGDGSQTRAFSDVSFYMTPFEALISGHDGEVFNLGADRHVTILEAANLVRRVARELGFQTDLEFLEPRHEVHNAFCSHEKAKQLLGFRDETDIEKTVREMFAWAMNEPPKPVVTKQYEISDGLYSYWERDPADHVGPLGGSSERPAPFSGEFVADLSAAEPR